MVDRFVGGISDKILALLSISPIAASLLSLSFSPSLQRETQGVIALTLFISVLAFVMARMVIPHAGEKLKPKLNGVDLGKVPRQPPIPQSLGLISGTSFLVSLVLIQAFVSPEMLKPKYDMLMLSVCFSVLLGLADDVMDIRWSHKLLMGFVASIPLLTKYDGPTGILIPRVIRPLLLRVQFVLDYLQWISFDGVVLDLGVFYLIYVVALIVFCTNAINIFAGINGIEVGQSIVIAIGICVMDCYELYFSDPLTVHYHNHVFSLTVMLPFILTSFALLTHNWFPAKVFIGDVFPYYAGMTFASTAVLGHYSRTLLLMLVPQVANYLYSMPQLAGFVPCPRHRLPAVNPETKLLEPSRVAPDSEVKNMTLLCLALRVWGPMRERSLTVLLLAIQACCTVLFGLVGRMVLAQLLF